MFLSFCINRLLQRYKIEWVIFVFYIEIQRMNIDTLPDKCGYEYEESLDISCENTVANKEIFSQKWIECIDWATNKPEVITKQIAPDEKLISDAQIPGGTYNPLYG